MTDNELNEPTTGHDTTTDTASTTDTPSTTDTQTTSDAETTAAAAQAATVDPPLPSAWWVDERLHMAFTGEPSDEDGLSFGNTVTVEVVDHAANPGFDTGSPDAAAEREWAADVDTRPLVRIDTNYKPSRPGPHPVDLTRRAALALAAAVLAAVEDTFHHARVGSLRATEALALLDDLAAVDEALLELRTHAVYDLGQAPERAEAARAAARFDDTTPADGAW